MVLVFEKLNYGIEDGHSEREPRLKIHPYTMHDESREMLGETSKLR
jgi:hypothetical protein